MGDLELDLLLLLEGLRTNLTGEGAAQEVEEVVEVGVALLKAEVEAVERSAALDPMFGWVC